MAKDLHAEYEINLREFRVEFSRGGAYTGIVLILLGVGLDYSLYPHMQLEFAAVRIGVSFLIYGIIRMMETNWGKDRIQWLTFAWLVLPQIMIAWMIAVTEGPSSIYYAGLTLAMYAAGIVLTFGLWQNIVFGALTILFYVLACAFHPNSAGLRGIFAVNVMLLFMAATVSAVYTYFNERGRFMLFRLKAELANKNEQLEETNKNLTEIKGHMLQQEKMAALGTLSAGLLHEVNNPVNYCLMAVDVAMENPAAKSNAPLYECLVDAKEGMQRIHHIVSDLKTFAYRTRDTSSLKKVFLLEKAIDSAVRLVGHETKGIAISRDLPSDTLVQGDEAAIVGVLVNLLSNAALAIRAANRAEPSVHLTAAWEGNSLRVTVQDNGPGIAPENLARVFEPFFTTREVGKGLGLGLSISYSVIERHGGTLTAESAVGEWTRMIFDLPRAA
ncbi:MAG: GHKL domain-containing protein [Burkholderiales bacterium]|nr:GHKL domain-containing protein [Burkholderiales bacterium]